MQLNSRSFDNCWSMHASRQNSFPVDPRVRGMPTNNKHLTVLSLFVFLDVLGFRLRQLIHSLILPLLPYFVGEFNLSPFEATLLTSANAVAQVFDLNLIFDALCPVYWPFERHSWPSSPAPPLCLWNSHFVCDVGNCTFSYGCCI